MGDGISNEELVEKAVITTDALAAAGKLNAAQADRFIDYVIDETVLKNNARVERFRNETLDIDKIGLGRRAAVPKAEAVDPGIRRGVSTSKISLEPKAVMVPFEISDEFKETSIEGDNVEDHIIKMMARQFANDLEELYLNADTLGPAIIENDYRAGGSTTEYIKDAYLALLTAGWLRLADGANIYDAGGANIGLSVFGGMVRQMPTKFRRNKKDLRFFLSSDLLQLYIEKLSTRATPLGDATAGGQAHTPYGIQCVDVPLLDFLPQIVEHTDLAASATFGLRYGPVSSVVVTTQLGDTPESAFVEDVDYSVDYTVGSITNLDNNIGDGDPIKITYSANPQALLTHMNNFIVGIGRDIRIEKDRDIFKTVNQYAITAKVAVQLEELEAVVKGQNIGTGI